MSTHWQPNKGQQIMTRLMVSQAAAGLLADPGLGKTSSVLAAVRLLRDRGAVRRTLVIAPLRVVYEVWRNEREKWVEFNDLKLELLHGTKKDQALARRADIYVTNFASLDWIMTKLGWYAVERIGGQIEMRHDPKRATAAPFDCLVVDESTALRNTGTNRFRLMRAFIQDFRRRYIMTGTPTPNGLMNLFGQIYVLDCGSALGAYISHYRQKFFEEDAFVPHSYRLQNGAAQKIYKAIAPLVCRLEADDYVDMPKRVVQDIVVELPPKVRAAYDRLEAAFFAEFNKGTVTAVNAAAMTSKLRQIANGGVYLDGGETEHAHTAKIDALEELVDELQGQPVFVAYEFKHDLERLQKAFPRAPVIGGGISAGKVKEAVAAWNRGSIPVLFGHPASAGHGLNLQGGGYHVCFASLSYDLETHEQFICRVQRQGQKSKRVFVHRIITRNTIDQVMIDRLAQKDELQRSLLAALKRYGRERYRV